MIGRAGGLNVVVDHEGEQAEFLGLVFETGVVAAPGITRQGVGYLIEPAVADPL